MAAKVSIVIVCMNRTDNLYPCLSTLHEHTKTEHETFVVAYLFDKEALAKAREDFPWVTFIESDQIRGFSENNNLALRQVTTPYTFVLNDDTEIHGDTIDRLIEDMEKLPSDAAIVSPKLLNADLSLQLCGRPVYPAYKYALQQFHLYKEPIDNEPAGNNGALFRSWNITGAAFLIKTDIFRELGWFDQRYFFTPEDLALSTLAVHKGYSLWVDPRAEVVHKWRTTASRIMGATRPAAVRGSIIFFSEWRHPGERNFLSGVNYFLLGGIVLIAETAKLLKASIKYLITRKDSDRLKRDTFRHITRSIFTTKTPKEIFTKYYLELKKGK